mgnify:CR=1 FL=1
MIHRSDGERARGKEFYIHTLVSFSNKSRMRIHLFVFLLVISQIHAHGQHNPNSQVPIGGQPAHLSRKMEDFVHDKK